MCITPDRHPLVSKEGVHWVSLSKVGRSWKIRFILDAAVSQFDEKENIDISHFWTKNINMCHSVRYKKDYGINGKKRLSWYFDTTLSKTMSYC